MKELIYVSAFLGLVFGRISALADELDDAFVAVRTFESEKDAEPLKLIETAAVEALNGTPEERSAMEDRLISALEGATTRRGKSFLCRQLRIAGTVKSVTALEKLLGNPVSSHPARYALASIGSPEAAAALHRALEAAPDSVKPGLLESLGHLGYGPATPDMVALLGSKEDGIAGAAATALGRVGNLEGIRALREKFDAEDTEFAHALLLGARTMAANNRAAEAEEIFSTLASGNYPANLRVAALTGLASLGQKESDSLAQKVVQAIRAEDPELSAPAIGIVPLVRGEQATELFVSLLEELPAEKQAPLVRMIGQRKDAASRDAVRKQLGSENELVQVAALESISPDSAAELFQKEWALVAEYLKMAAHGSASVQRSAIATLIQFDAGQATDGIFVAALEHDDPSIRVAAVGMLGKRAQRTGMTATADADRRVLLLTAAADSDVRKAAISAVASVAAPALGDLKLLLDHLLSPASPRDRQGLATSIAKVIARAENPASHALLVLESLEKADEDSRPHVLSLLSGTPSPEALNVVRDRLRHGNESDRSAAVRTLSNWPHKGAVPDLIALAEDKTAGDRDRILAVRGYISLSDQLDNQEAALHEAFSLAMRPDEKKLALGELGNVGGVESLALVEQAMTDDSIKNEAAFAAVGVASRAAESAPEKVIALMEKMLASKGKLHRRIARDARRALDTAKKAKGPG